MNEHLILFENWGGILKVLLVTPVLYVAIVLFIRIGGKRMTSQMNNFDWIFTIALGSLIASPILLKDVVLSEALLAIATLMSCQWLLTLTASRSERFNGLVRADPTLLLHRGEYCRDAMRRERISEQEILASIRENGIADPGDVDSVILESDAKLSVIPRSAKEDARSADPDGALEGETNPGQA